MLKQLYLRATRDSRNTRLNMQHGISVNVWGGKNNEKVIHKNDAAFNRT